jgi:hypothetical protein
MGVRRIGEATRKTIAIHDRYQRIVGLVMGAATASLVLPLPFLRMILSVPPKRPIVEYLSLPIYLSWSALLLSLLSSIFYFYFSAQWVRHACGEPTSLGARSLERIQRLLFRLAIFGFLTGIGGLLYVFAGSRGV